MNIARINFAHGDPDNHRQVIGHIRTAAEETGQRVAIMGDLPGPKMRIGDVQPDPLTLARDQPFTLAAGDFVGDAKRASMKFPGLAKAVYTGDEIYINDGFVKLVVEEVEGDEVRCRVSTGIARETETYCSAQKIVDFLRDEQSGDDVDTNNLVSMSVYVSTRAHDTVAVVTPP